MSTAKGAYSWLMGKGQITQGGAPLADPASSRLSWLGSDMPPSGPRSNPDAAKALADWAAAGAQDN
jgi:hypothetical protein